MAETLLQVVADKTGYPIDMLELDMQLDADLGIDSIKRVEIFSAVQDRLPEAPIGQARAPGIAAHASPGRRVPRPGTGSQAASRTEARGRMTAAAAA